MSDRSWRKWEIAGLFFVLIWGNVFHFVYDWSGQNAVVGGIAAVNESVWEHVKLLIVPWVLWSVVEAVVLRRSRDSGVLIGRALGLVAGVLFIIAAYYTYVGATGMNVDIVNILIFQAAVLLAFFVSWRVQNRGMLRGNIGAVLGAMILLLLLVLAVFWTYMPPALPLFTDRQTGQAGLPTRQ